MTATSCSQGPATDEIGEDGRDAKEGHNNHENVCCDTKGLLNEYPKKEEKKGNLQSPYRDCPRDFCGDQTLMSIVSAH